MPQAHFLCRNSAGIHIVKMPNYVSEAWDIPESDAKALVGGMIYFHETKEQASYFGGRVTGYRRAEGGEGRRPRVIFELTAMREARGQAWAGKDHGMAHYSGVC
jgi:hypothetical protein